MSHHITALLEQAATLIMRRPRRLWAGWILYLVEIIDAKTSDPSFTADLVRLRDSIDARLRTGKW